MPTELWSMGLIASSSIISATASFFFKKASKSFSISIALIKNRWLILGGMLYIISAIIALIAFKGGELSVLVPIASLNYIWAIILSKKFLSEKMNKHKWTGILLVLAGVSLIGVS